jgi:hypothetical protein
MNSLIGQQLGPYRILQEIGRGGMSIVYKAWNTAHNRNVALKVLPPYFQHDSEFLRRFLEEARRAIPLRHIYVVETYEAGQANGYYYIAMEYMAGGSLAARLRTQGRPSLEDATTILSQIAAALDYAHDQGLVHRDVKPSNILFDQSRQAKLADFGIAKAADQATMTLPGTLVGTPEYMSPEQAQGRPLDERTDIWSLGVVLYQMLTGRLPFGGDNPHATLYQVVHQAPLPASSLNRDLPQTVDKILAQALEKPARRRYRRAGEMAGALRQVVHGPTERPTVFRGKEEPATTKLPREMPAKGSPFPLALLGIFGGLGVVVLALVLVLGLNRGGNLQSTPIPGLTEVPVAVVVTTETPVPATRPPMATVTQTPGVPIPSPAAVLSPTPLVMRFDVRGTLQNTETGFRLQFTNIFASITVKRVMAVAVDRESIPLEEIRIRTPAVQELTAAQISPERSLHLGLNSLVTAEVTGKPLSTGRHEITLALLTEEAGNVEITLTDIVEPTPMPKVTATFTSAPTVTPRATRTPTTATPTATRIPTMTAVPEANITLIRPANGATEQNLVTFQWQWTRALDQGEIFDVRVCKGDDCQPRFGKTNTADTTWVWCPDDGTGAYRWQVMVIDRASKQTKGPASEVWQFHWEGGECGTGGGGGGPKPIVTPR